MTPSFHFDENTVTLAPSASYPANTGGDFWKCQSATGAFRLSLDNQKSFAMQAGRRARLPAGTSFTSFLITNPSATASVTITYVTGFGEIEDNPQVLVGATTVSISTTAASMAEGTHLFVANDTPEALSSDPSVVIQQITIYPAKGIAGGKLTPNTVGDIWAGNSGGMTPDMRAITDTSYPIVYASPAGQHMRLMDILVQGKIGDGVVFTYS